jgi:hypothetical protein
MMNQEMRKILRILVEGSDDPQLAKTLLENEHVLSSPEIIGTDEEKIAAIGYWAGVVGTLRTLNTLMVSHRNKMNMIAAIRNETDLVQKEIENATSQMRPDGVPGMYQDPAAAPVEATPVVDLGRDEITTVAQPSSLPRGTEVPAPNNPSTVVTPSLAPPADPIPQPSAGAAAAAPEQPTLVPGEGEVNVVSSPKAKIELQQENLKKQKELERLQRAAGTWYLSKKVSVLETHKSSK